MTPAFERDDARADLGYVPAPAPALSQPRPARITHGQCRTPRCEFEGVLFPTPWSGDRTHCAACSGRAYRDLVEDTRLAIRDLKNAAAMGDGEGERSAFKKLAALVGDHQARETANAIAHALAEKPAKGGRR